MPVEGEGDSVGMCMCRCIRISFFLLEDRVARRMRTYSAAAVAGLSMRVLAQLLGIAVVEARAKASSQT